MPTPTLSTIIPTCARSSLLRLAIASALEDGGITGEVIVVPNGPDNSWKEVKEAFTAEARVVFSPIDHAHANHARNHGKRIATGKFIRFLDDDDLVMPGASLLQCCLMEQSESDICSGGIELIDATGSVFRTWQQPDTNDFVQSILMPGRVTANLAHVFRRVSLEDLEWDESIALGQDTHWMHSLCRRREWRWIRTDCIVGRWRHHPAPRISSSAKLVDHLRASSTFLLETTEHLSRSERLDAPRRSAATTGLWKMAHAGFFLDPAYWWRMIRTIREFSPGSTPDIGFYQTPLSRFVHPLVLESVMLPKRKINHMMRKWQFSRGRISQVIPP